MQTKDGWVSFLNPAYGLTTLGYGDILPQTIYAQSLTVMETVVGQLCLAVLVAALVSAYLNDVRDGSDAGGYDGESER